MDKKELEARYKFNLPADMEFSLEGDSLEVILGNKSYNANMQEDSSAFESWVICLMAMLKKDNAQSINHVSIRFKEERKIKNCTPQERQLYYRLFKANLNYGWEIPAYAEIEAIVKPLEDAVLTVPSNEAEKYARNTEAILERNYIEAASNEGRKVYQQLPLGFFRGSVSEKYRLTPTSFLDMWELERPDTLTIYELKAKGNKKAGIISELLYYTNILADILKKDTNIEFKESYNNYRGIRILTECHKDKSIRNITGIFLTDELHPMIEEYKDEILEIINNTGKKNGISISYSFKKYTDNISDYSEYREEERSRQELLLNGPDNIVFPPDVTGGGWYKGRERTFCIEKGKEAFNLYPDIRYKVQKYFAEEGIAFWGVQNIVPNHILSSQVSCLNHLFAVREDKEMVLEIAKAITKRKDIKEMKRIDCDKEPQFIAFEAVSDADFLNEGNSSKRGAFRTSIDAVMLAALEGKSEAESSTLLIAIEWKYTESYSRDDKSVESDSDKPMQPESKGIERLNRYCRLINDSEYLKPFNGDSCENELGLSNDILPYRNSIYFQEPFYQLMRQTLWAEQMIKHNSTERIKATEFMHIHIIPSGNTALLGKGFNTDKSKGTSMEDSWIQRLKDDKQNIYKRVDPETIRDALVSKYPELYNYLKTRYYI